MRAALRIAALICLPFAAQAQAQGVMLDDAVSLPDFSFHDEQGGRYTSADLKGNWTIVMIGFLTCPDVCPFTLGNLEAAVAETGLRVRPDKVPKVWFLSVDPDRDADYVSEYGPFFHPDFRSMTGARDQIDTFIAATDSFYRLMPAAADGEYEVQHRSAVSVIAPDGPLRAKLQPPFAPSMPAEFLARLQIGYRRELSQ